MSSSIASYLKVGGATVAVLLLLLCLTFDSHRDRYILKTGIQPLDRSLHVTLRTGIDAARSTQGDYLWVQGYHANLRSHPDLATGQIIEVLEHNDYCKVLARTPEKTTIEGLGTDYWYQVQSGDQQGWVFGKLVNVEYTRYGQTS